MARRKRARKHQSKRRKGRKGGRLWVILLGVALVLYFVFTRVFFDPFEGSVPTFRLIVPQDVDLYLHRERLDTDFESFPRPNVPARWMRTRQWRELAKTDWYASTGWPRDMDGLVEPLEAMLADTGPIDVLADVLGQEVALVGRDPGTADHLALLARLSPKGKLAVEALDLAEGALAGMTRSEVKDPSVPAVRWYALEPDDGGETLYYQRVQDLLVFGDDEALVRDILRNAVQGSELTVGLSRLYYDNVQESGTAPEDRFQMEWFADVRQLVDAYDVAPDLEDRSEDALLNVLPRVIDWDLLQEGVGHLALDARRVDASAFVALDTARAREDKGGLLGQPDFAVGERLDGLLSMLPDSTGAVLTANLDLKRFLTAVVEGLDPELVQLMDETIQGVANWNVNWPIRNTRQLIDELARVLQGELTVAVRPLDHVIPEGLQPVPALAFLLPVRDAAGWEGLAQAFINGNQALGVDNEDMWRVKHGNIGERKHMALVGMAAEDISFIVLDGETLVLTTDDEFTQEIITTYQGGQGAASVAAGELVAAFSEDGRPTRGNVASWVDVDVLREILAPYAEWRAELDTQIDFVTRRAYHKTEIVRREYPQYAGGELPGHIAEPLEQRLDEILDQEEQQRMLHEVPEAAREWSESLLWLELLKQAAFSVRLGERSTDVALHLTTVVE